MSKHCCSLYRSRRDKSRFGGGASTEADKRSAPSDAPIPSPISLPLPDAIQSEFNATVVDDGTWQRFLSSGKRDFSDFVRAEEAVERFKAGERNPPLCNTGGNSGEVGSSPGEDVKIRPDVPWDAAFVDYLRFTIPVSAYSAGPTRLDEDRFILSIFSDLKRLFGLSLGVRRDVRRFFYERSYTFQGTRAGGVFIGGNRDTCCIDLPGSICARATDWKAVSDWLSGLDATITRVDLARDCLEGEYTVDDARRWYEEGGFTINRKPLANFMDDCGSNKGCTFYVGSRDNGKLFRAYDKAKQLGLPDGRWVRFEVELKNKDRVIPVEVLTNPGGYLAGAYPCLAWVDDAQERVKTLNKSLKISYDKLRVEAKKAYGRLINFMSSAGFSAEEIVADLINTKGFPRRMEAPLFALGFG